MELVWQDQTPLAGGPAISTSITNVEAAELGRLAKGRRVLEVGAAYGYSTVILALGGAVEVFSVDHHEWLDSYPVFAANVRAYGVAPLVVTACYASFTVLPRLADQGEQFGLVFLDGDHEDTAVAYDADWARKLLGSGGVLACHDYGEDTCPGVALGLHRTVGFPTRVVDTLAIYEGLAA